MLTLTSDDRELLEFLWSQYRANGGWPTRRAIALWLDQRGTLFVDKPQLGRIAHLGAQIARDAVELQLTAGAGAWKSTMILAGSIAEAILVDFLSLNQGRAETHCSKGEKWPERVGLQTLIKAANAEQLLQKDSAQLAEQIKEYRDLIHPRRAASTTLRPDRVAAKTIVHLLERVVADLLAAADDGRLTRYQTT